MNGQFFILIAFGFLLLFSGMTILWLIQRKTKNAGIVDILWALSFPILTIFYSFFTNGIEIRENILIVLTVLWGGRLGYHLFMRNVAHSKHEDIRYAQLREEWGPRKTVWMMFLFYQFQAVIASIISIVFLLILNNPSESIQLNEWIGMGIWLASLIGETAADLQLKNFKNRTANSTTKEICEDGLWNYSRHPNYFFEWLTWVGFFIMALSAPYGWVSAICPLIMLFLLTKLSGIPMTEELMLKSRGEKFKHYQETTSAFFPWFKKNKRF